MKDATVTATGPGGPIVGATDDRGRYELSVRRGAYTVRADAGPLKIKTKAKRVDLRSRTSAKAVFEACGTSRTVTAAAAAVGGGVWRGGNEDCLNYLEVSWRPSTGVRISWVSIPVCSAVGGNCAGRARALLRGQALDPSQQGQNLTVKDREIGFFYPIFSPHSGHNVNGTLRADGSGTVNARYVEGLCTFSIAKLKLRRG